MDWRIFLIGPMPDKGDDHFDRVVEAVVAELEEHGYTPPVDDNHELTGGTSVDTLVLTRPADGDEVTLIKPHELFRPGSIRENVFDAIDDADLVIADLSDVRPAVVYELAFAHALGIWTILLGSDADASAMFYLRDYRHARVDFTKEDIRSAEFALNLRTWLRDRGKRFDAKNPFTDFYGAPIPDISAANGLASGYFENFLRPVLMPGSRVLDKTAAPETSAEVAGVLVVRPPDLRKLGDIIESMDEILRTGFPDAFRRGKRGSVYVETPAGARTAEFIVGGWLIDVPRTLLTLERSPRLRRTSSHAGMSSAVLNQRAHRHLSGVLIERFLEGARMALDRDQDVLRAERRFYYGSPDDIVAFLRQTPGNRPSVW